MSPSASRTVPAEPTASEPVPDRNAGPGRPKDPGKRAAILDAAKQLFARDGFAGASMDQIAAEAGVSKLTVYSHFGDKDKLFVEAVKAHCERQLPSSLFDTSPDTPLRARLLEIARAFYAMISAPEAVAGHRILCTPQITGSALPELFWKAGPQRVQDDFTLLLERRIANGQLVIDDPGLASSQFFALLKGERHARLVLGCDGGDARAVESHLAASVDLFLRAYAPAAANRAAQ